MSDGDRLWTAFAVAVAFVLGMHAGAEGARGKPGDVVIPTVVGLAILTYLGVRAIGIGLDAIRWLWRRRG